MKQTNKKSQPPCWLEVKRKPKSLPQTPAQTCAAMTGLALRYYRYYR